MTKYFLLIVICLSQTFPALAVKPGDAVCPDLVGNGSEPKKEAPSLAALLRTPREGWELARVAIQDARMRFEGSDYVLHALYTAVMAKEFAWFNGDPGGAKTKIARLVFEAELRSLTSDQKKNFVLQFHKLLNDGVITGFPDLQQMLENGAYKRNIDDALIADKFIFIIADEVEKGNPALLSTLLSVLNERKAFLGAEVVEAILTAGVFTSNKTVGEMVTSAEDDKSAIEALLDRLGVKVHVINQTLDALGMMRLRKKIVWSDAHPWDGMGGVIHMSPVVKDVQIPSELLSELVGIAKKLDSFYVGKHNGDKSYFPPNQFSIRSLVKILPIWKASFLASQLMEGKSFDQIRWKMEAADLRHLAAGMLLNGPGSIRTQSTKLSVKVLDPDTGAQVHKADDAAYEPLTGRLTFSLEDGNSLSMIFDPLTQKIISEDRFLGPDGEVLKASDVLNLSEVKKSIAQIQGRLPLPTGIEDDGVLGRYVNLRGVPRKTKNELGFIQESRTIFINMVNAATAKLSGKTLDYNLKDDNSVRDRLETEIAGQNLAKYVEDVKSGRKKISEVDYYKMVAATIKHGHKELNQDYRELDHSIRAHFTSILSNSHVLAYGPPGGGKTALSRTILLATLDSVNSSVLAPMMVDFGHRLIRRYKDILDKMSKRDKNYKKFELFFRQFHKMVPEGEISGFQKLNEQLKGGRIVYDRSQSLSHERFLFAIFDEVEKGNPALLQTLLSVLNEREVFAGHEVVKASLATAILTSNKVPFEFLEIFGNDKSTAIAFLDRTINKVFVHNKFSDDKSMVSVLKDIESGNFNPRLSCPLMLLELQPLLKKVQIPNGLELVMTQTMFDWQATRLEKEEAIGDVFAGDPIGSPNYYVPGSKRSNRSGNAILEQVKASYIMKLILTGRFDQMIDDQARAGRSWEQMKFEPTFEDVALVSHGMLFWGPFEFVTKYNRSGIVQVELRDAELQSLINSGGTSDRIRYQLQMILDEAQDFVASVNKQILSATQQQRELIGKYPKLFPGLFKRP